MNRLWICQSTRLDLQRRYGIEEFRKDANADELQRSPVDSSQMAIAKSPPPAHRLASFQSEREKSQWFLFYPMTVISTIMLSRGIISHDWKGNRNPHKHCSIQGCFVQMEATPNAIQLNREALSNDKSGKDHKQPFAFHSD
jgi:hypothetical protein